MRRPSRRERGAILAWASLMLVMLFAFAVVAVDVGRLAFTANEVQAVADIAATAGATTVGNGGTAATAVNDARDVVALNTVDGHPASIAASDVIVGRYDADTKTFTAGATPNNAVRANAMATVNNILAMIFGTASTTVEKTSTAVVATVQSGTPTLPLAIGECHFEGLCPGCLPTLTQAPNSDNNSAWTGFFDGSAEDDVTSFMPQSCGGGGIAVPELRVGDTIHLTDTRSFTEALTAVKCQVDDGHRDFVIPVIGQDVVDPNQDDDTSNEGNGDDDSHSDDGDRDQSNDDDSHSEEGVGDECNGALTSSGHVVGFVTVHVDKVVTSGDTKGITLHGIPNAGVPGTPGGDCENCRSGHAVLVN